MVVCNLVLYLYISVCIYRYTHKCYLLFMTSLLYVFFFPPADSFFHSSCYLPSRKKKLVDVIRLFQRFFVVFFFVASSSKTSPCLPITNTSRVCDGQRRDVMRCLVFQKALHFFYCLSLGLDIYPFPPSFFFVPYRHSKRHAFLLLVVRPGAPSSFLFLVVMPGAPSSVLAPDRTTNLALRELSCFSSGLCLQEATPRELCRRRPDQIERTLLGASGIATRNKDATGGSWPYY